ncbi:MAG: TlpA family protein disulfide reductase [Myxococcaceae bacterium]|nr:TlpA family protein disulfide reductase [Myxococcaceae bacterium]
MKSETVKALFFWFSIALITALILFQVSKRSQLALQGIPLQASEAVHFKLDGVELTQFQGKKVLLHFWATWCKACRDEMPLLISLAQRQGDKLEILAIAVDSSPQSVQEFFGAEQPPFRVLYDLKSQLAEKYGVYQFPESILINEEGQLETLYVGPQNWELF